MKKVNILGIEYKIYLDKGIEEEPRFKNMDGFTDFYTKEIYVDKRTIVEGEDSCKNLIIYQKSVLRHEIIHAFLYESGLAGSSHKPYAWAENEEMVDWFAIQSPKIFKIYKELNIL